MTQRSDLRIRAMVRDDIPAVAALEAECFSDPWSVAMIEEELENPLCTMHIAECGGEVLGYAGIQVIVGEGYITNVAVTQGARRKGIGRRLMESFIKAADAMKLEFITLEVRASNAPAVALYSSLGFKRVGVRAGYYKNPTEDALLMTLDF